jgi:translation initiation factor IF-3
VRVIDANGEQLGIMQTQDAIHRAHDQGLQLVEVNPKTNPPVCKILDYGKFKYETAKREREAKKARTRQELKEVKFRPKTHDHDFDFKVKHARRFLEEGNKVRLLIQFRGRELTHPETGRAVLERVCKAVADLATVAQMASLEGNRMNMILAPKARREGGPAPAPAPEAPRGRSRGKGKTRRGDDGDDAAASDEASDEADAPDAPDAPDAQSMDGAPAPDDAPASPAPEGPAGDDGGDT